MGLMHIYINHFVGRHLCGPSRGSIKSCLVTDYPPAPHHQCSSPTTAPLYRSERQHRVSKSRQKECSSNQHNKAATATGGAQYCCSCSIAVAVVLLQYRIFLQILDQPRDVPLLLARSSILSPTHRAFGKASKELQMPAQVTRMSRM